MYCKRCGEKITYEEARFCPFCGIKLDNDNKTDKPVAAATLRKKCPFCGNSIPTVASVCHDCHADLTGLDQIQFIDGFVSWTLLAGQLAVFYDGKELDDFTSSKGIVIASGLKALLYNTDGCYLGMLDSGTYLFNNDSDDRMSTSIHGAAFWNKINGIKAYYPRFTVFENLPIDITPKVTDWREPVLPFNENRSDLIAVLVYELAFPLPISLPEKMIVTGKKKDYARINLFINNVFDFYSSEFCGKRFVCFERVSDILSSELNKSLPVRDGASDDMFSILSDNWNRYVFEKIFPFFSFGYRYEESRGKLREELCIPDSELKKNQTKIDFFNSIQRNQISRKINEADSIADFNTLIDELDCPDNDNVDYLSLLKVEKVVREARTIENIDSSIDWCIKKGIIQNDEVASIKNGIGLRSALFKQSDSLGILLNLHWKSEWNQIFEKYRRMFDPVDPRKVKLKELPIDYEKRNEIHKNSNLMKSRYKRHLEYLTCLILEINN